MVQINRFAVALAIGSASAVPHLNLPSFNLPFTFTLPAYGVSTTSTSAPTLPGYGGGASSSTATLSATKSASSSSEATKPISSIASTGTAISKSSSVVASEIASTKSSSIVSSGGVATTSSLPPIGTGSTSPVTITSSTSTQTAVSVGPVTGTSKAPSTGTSSVGSPPVGTSPAGSGTSLVGTTPTSSAASGTSPLGTSPAASGASTSTSKKTCTKKKTTSVPSAGTSTQTAVSVGPVTGTSKAASTGTSSAGSGTASVGTSPAGSGTSPVGTSPASSGTTPVGTSTSKKTCTKKKTTSKPSASASKPASSGVSSGCPASSGVYGSVSSSKPPSTTGSSSRPTVSTTSGNVVGYAAPNTTNVWQYLGIKFGQAPVGSLRFKPPVAYTGTGLINGSTFGDDCACTNLNVPNGLDPRLSTLFNTLAQTNASLSEDCLFVNVWAKAGSKGKPVLVWIYGGGFNFGGTNSEAYNGRYFADQEDVVFASFNYRTNIMGFPGAPNTTANIGLLDQRLAIEWIRDNIAAFGGDPSRITIFGQSAGGASVDLYTFSHYDDPIIAGAIPMSGTASSFGDKTADQALVNWDNATTSLGCGNSSNTAPETVLACMQSPSITWQQIQEVTKAKAGLTSLLGGFGPSIDDTIVFSNYTERALDGYVAKVPVLTGSCNYESGLFILISAGAGESYPQSFWDYVDTQFFTCPISSLAHYRAAIGVPSWRYYYSGAWPNLVLPTANLTQAWHTSEVPVLFDVAAEITITANTPNETALGNYMRGVWADFAADPVNALAAGGKYNWPEYSTGMMVNLGKNNETTAAFSDASEIETSCSF